MLLTGGRIYTMDARGSVVDTLVVRDGRQLGIIPSMQPTHCLSDMRWVEQRLGPERIGGAASWRSLLATGVVIVGGSDFPVEDANPFHGVQAAVTRRPLDGDTPAGVSSSG